MKIVQAVTSQRDATASYMQPFGNYTKLTTTDLSLSIVRHHVQRQPCCLPHCVSCDLEVSIFLRATAIRWVFVSVTTNARFHFIFFTFHSIDAHYIAQHWFAINLPIFNFISDVQKRIRNQFIWRICKRLAQAKIVDKNCTVEQFETVRKHSKYQVSKTKNADIRY